MAADTKSASTISKMTMRAKATTRGVCTDHEHRERRRALSVGPAAEAVHQREQRHRAQRGRQARRGFRFAEGRHGECDQAEVERGLVEVGQAVVGRDEPGPRVLHLARHFGVPAFVRLDQGQRAQPAEQADRGDQERQGREQPRAPRHRRARSSAWRASAKTRWNIGRVSKPVLVFRRLGW